MSNGVSAQNAFRYQDWCAIHFLLNHYLENDSSLEYLICENDKLDFEIWLTSQFEGYQVKSKNYFSAQDLNDLLKFFIQYIQNISKDCFVYLVFQNEPIKSFRLLVIKLSGDRTIKSVGGITKNYFSVALNGVGGLSKIKIDYKILSKKGVRRSVYGLAKEVLEEHYSEEQDLPTGMIDNFVVRLKDKIEEISSNNSIEDRRIERKILENIINKIITSQGFSRQNRSGEPEFVRIELPIDESLEINIRKIPPFKKPSILP